MAGDWHSVRWKLALAGLILLGLLAASAGFDLPARSIEMLDWIESQGAGGAAMFVVFYVAATVFAFPASLLTLGAGAVYGLALGFALVSLGSTVGATLAFLLARYVARDWIARRIAQHPKFKALDEGVAEEGWKIVLLTRLSPAFPFNLQNYGYGLTGIPAMHYVFASWIGMIPGTLMYVYLGHAAGSLAAASSTSVERSPAQWSLLALGLLATLAVTVLVTRLARRKLAEVEQRT
jgi:uncharacterized membrane protein YdjX (TVP38/TMEM64 family)